MGVRNRVEFDLEMDEPPQQQREILAPECPPSPGIVPAEARPPERLGPACHTPLPHLYLYI
jgi:hypothetical protein